MKLSKHTTPQPRNYICDNCGEREKHIDMYNDKYCYNCIDIDTGELNPEKIKIKELM